eukprot:scaffold76_cov363-Pavlova_lutheri.AAC.13
MAVAGAPTAPNVSRFMTLRLAISGTSEAAAAAIARTGALLAAFLPLLRVCRAFPSPQRFARALIALAMAAFARVSAVQMRAWDAFHVGLSPLPSSLSCLVQKPYPWWRQGGLPPRDAFPRGGRGAKADPREGDGGRAPVEEGDGPDPSASTGSDGGGKRGESRYPTRRTPEHAGGRGPGSGRPSTGPLGVPPHKGEADSPCFRSSGPRVRSDGGRVEKHRLNPNHSKV